MAALLLAGGLVALLAGAEALVRGASRLATAAGISPLVVGLTVVAFGTSAPELAISLQAARAGQSDIAIGNVVGSNIFNILLILGLSAAITPLVVASRLVRHDVPLVIAVSAAFWVMASDGAVVRAEGLLLAAGAVVYTGHLMLQSRRDRADAGWAGAGGQASGTGMMWHVLVAAGGLGLLVAGARWFVQGAVSLARMLGVEELVIGLTIVAAGTSLPEVATSIVAAIRGQRDIAVGNVVGSNLFNILVVLGLTASVSPAPLAVAAGVVTADLPIMLAVAIACLPIFFTGYTIARWEGWVFLGYYAAYTVYLVLTATEHAAIGGFQVAMLVFVIPLTLLTLAISTWRHWHRPGRRVD